MCDDKTLLINTETNWFIATRKRDPGSKAAQLIKHTPFHFLFHLQSLRHILHDWYSAYPSSAYEFLGNNMPICHSSLVYVHVYVCGNSLGMPWWKLEVPMELFRTRCLKVKMTVLSVNAEKCFSRPPAVFSCSPFTQHSLFLHFQQKSQNDTDSCLNLTYKYHICKHFCVLLCLTARRVRFCDSFWCCLLRCMCVCVGVCVSVWSKQSSVKLSSTKTLSLNKPVWHHFEVLLFALPQLPVLGGKKEKKSLIWSWSWSRLKKVERNTFINAI